MEKETIARQHVFHHILQTYSYNGDTARDIFYPLSKFYPLKFLPSNAIPYLVPHRYFEWFSEYRPHNSNLLGCIASCSINVFSSSYTLKIDVDAVSCAELFSCLLFLSTFASSLACAAAWRY